MGGGAHASSSTSLPLRPRQAPGSQAEGEEVTTLSPDPPYDAVRQRGLAFSQLEAAHPDRFDPVVIDLDAEVKPLRFEPSRSVGSSSCPTG